MIAPLSWLKDYVDIDITPQELQDKHYYRKHGANAYYGQGK